MEKIGIFGGSFNPVHKEHVKVAIAAKNAFSLDRLIVMPTNISPHKLSEDLCGAHARLDMLKIAFDGVKGVEISDYEIKKQGVSYTCLTLGHLKDVFPDSKLFFLMGADMLADFPTWKDPEKILSLAEIIVTPREGEDLAAALTSFYERFSLRPLISPYVGKNVSGTTIRNSIVLGLDRSDVLDEKVAKYVKENRLYGGGKYAYCAEYVKNALKTKRLYHTAGVMTLAKKYAKRLKADEEKAVLAAMLHDVAKYKTYEEFGLTRPIDVPDGVLHQFLGAYICENVLKIDDEDVLNAVRYHTTGRAAMSDLERIVFTADLLEEGRDFEGVDRLRKAVNEDFDKGFAACIAELFSFLNEKTKKEDIYYLSEKCKEYYCG